MKRMVKLLGLLPSFLLASVLPSKAQQHDDHKNCGHHVMQQKLYEKYPELEKSEADFRTTVLNYINQMDPDALPRSRGGDTIFVPIVFHVLHNYGIEDISDAQIYNQMRILNEDFQKRNADTSVVLPIFKDRIGNAQFYFRLANKDPQGNCTNGIDRIYTYKTNFADDQSKLNQWPMQHYLNVWVVKSIGSAGVAGYAYKPISVGNIWFWDGIIILHDFVGAIGTGTPGRSRALTHEIGHYFSLDHPWGPTNNPNVACGDDGIDDTPKTKGATVCNLNDATNDCDTVRANIQNFMDYSYCSVMFTKGQATYMNFIANNSLYRKLLFSPAARVATGINTDGCFNCYFPKNDCAPVVDFNANRLFTCVGGSIQLRDYSRDSVVSRVWNIPNATIADNTALQINPTFNTPGWTNVGLTVTDTKNQSSSTTKNNLVYVSDGNASLRDVMRFEDPNQMSEWPIFNYFNNQFTWERSNRAGLFSGWSMMYKNYDNRVFPENVRGSSDNDYDDFFTPAYDLSSYAGTVCNLNFWTSAASSKTAIFGNNDSLLISFSPNCGATWITLKSYKANELFNKVFTGDYAPETLSDWFARTVTLPAAAKTANTYFRFRYYPTSDGNNFFIDDIGVSAYPTEVATTQRLADNFIIYPNPTLDGRPTVSLAVTEDAQYTLSITDMVGRTIHTVASSQISKTNSQYTIPAGVLNAKGVYFVSLSKNGQVVNSQKFIYQ